MTSRLELSRLAAVTVAAIGIGGCDASTPLRPESADFARIANMTVPKAPSAADAIPILSDRVDIFWTDNSTNEDGFRVERSADGGLTWALAKTLSVSSVAFVDEGRTPERRVCYRVIAFNAKGSSAPSNVDCTTPPATPTNVAAAALDAHTVRVTWTDNSAVETGYYLTRWTGDDRSSETRIGQAPANATTYRDTTMPSAAAYSYRVWATSDGGQGTPSAVATASPGAVTAPTNLMVSATFMDITLTWADNSSDEDGFALERFGSPSWEWEPHGGYPANATSAFDQSYSSAEQEICYRVSAFNARGRSAPTNKSCAYVMNAPSNVTARIADARTLELTWQNNSTFAASVEIRRGQSGAPMTLVATLPLTTKYRDTGLTPNITCWYELRAKLAQSVSESYRLSATIATTPPTGPTALAVSAFASSGLQAVWHDNASNESGYRIENSDDGGATWKTALTFPPDQETGFEFGLTPERIVCLRAVAFNASGNSPASNVVCTAPPATATALTAGIVGEHAVQITWRDNSAVEDGYDVLRTVIVDDTLEETITIGHVATNVTEFLDAAYAGGYANYRVVATLGAGSGDWSDYAEVNSFWPSAPTTPSGRLSPALSPRLPQRVPLPRPRQAMPRSSPLVRR